MSATRVDPQRVSWKTKLRIVCSVEAKREREREREMEMERSKRGKNDEDDCKGTRK